jgi:DNA-binding Lrp family transcriptional regulator
MVDTILSSKTKEVVIGAGRPFVINGERINPTGRKLLAAEMSAGNYERVRNDALAQVEAGAHMLDVNAGIPLADEPRILGEAIQLVQSVVECYLMTGNRDYLLRVVSDSLKSYERFIREVLTRLPGIASIESSFAFRPVKKGAVLPPLSHFE